MKNIIVDIGNFYFKYKGDNQGSFSSRYHSNFEPNPEAFERVEIDGITTYIGVGELIIKLIKILFHKFYMQLTKQLEIIV